MSSHVTLDTASQTMVCRHCGATQPLRTPAPITEVAEAMTTFAAAHEDCPLPEVLPVVKPRRPAPATTTETLFAWPGLAAWLDEGERGVSSEVIVQVITGIPMKRDVRDVPHDASDFRRCSLLLQRVPSLRAHLHKLSAISPRWACLVAAWPDLDDALADPERHGPLNQFIGRNATAPER